jgi:AcrR family transcriptional regulator
VAKGRPREFDLDLALDKALEVFCRRGYAGSSVAELTEAMGINPPSLYAAFGNKESLFRKALERYAVRRTAFWDEALTAPTARGMLEILLRETATFLTEACDRSGCLYVRTLSECGDTADVIQRELASRRAAGERVIRQRLESAKEDGELPANVNPADFARYVSTVLEGMSVQAAGGATRDELLRVGEMAMRLWPIEALGPSRFAPPAGTRHHEERSREPAGAASR